MFGSQRKAKSHELLKKGVKIPLFDVDGTLIQRGNKTHTTSFEYAFKNVYNLPTATIDQIPHDGMIDRQIITEVVKLHGVGESVAKAKLPDAIEAMREYYRLHEGEGTYIALPGTSEILSQLQTFAIPLGLLTGNIEEIGWKKLQSAGLRNFFDFGAFGDMADKRVDLVAIAIEQVNSLLQITSPLPASQFVIIGDSPLDVACAKAGGLTVIGVATGKFSVQQLTDAGADLVLETLYDQEKVFNVLNLIK